MQPDIVAFIFARGGSKGVPRKNLRPCAGKPLLAHAIAAARQAEGVRRVVVSTEDPEIAQAARAWGAETPFMRPADLARDDAPEWLAWRHAIRTMEQLDGRRPDVFLSVPPTAPLRKPEDIDECLRALQTHDADIAIIVTPARRHPSFNMVTVDSGLARLVMPPAEAVVRRQQASPVYDVTTVAYAARPEFILRANGLFEGKVAVAVVPEERAIDIDTELDLEIADFLLRRRRAEDLKGERHENA
jgi:CMP-N-acetylneuraminic acid synthetase